MKLVVSPPVDLQRLRRMQSVAGSMSVVNCHEHAVALEEIVDATAFFGKLTPELLAAARHLNWVQSPTASLEHYLFPELIEHSCQLTNMRGLFSDVIADHVLGYMLCVVRNLHVYLRRQFQQRWEPVGGEGTRADFATGPGLVTAIDRAHRQLSDCTVGIVGVGAIGSEIARRAAMNGMSVVGVDPMHRTLPGIISEIWPTAQLPRLLDVSDFVVIAAPHTPNTARLFRQSQFQQMRRSAWLINIGRGAIVDLGDLTTALQSGTIAGAALDVFEQEPLPIEHPLWRMENVLITPHIAAAAPIVSQRHLATLLENIRRYVHGEDLLNLTNKQLWF